MYQSWGTSYSAERLKHVDVNMEYDAVGSSSGIQQITGATDSNIHYAGSDTVLSEKQKIDNPDLKMFPMRASSF